MPPRPGHPDWRNPRCIDPKRSRTVETGIYLRHSSACVGGFDGPCTCRPTYQAQIHSARDKKLIRKTFRTLPQARQWRLTAKEKLRKGELSAPNSTRLKEAAEAWVKDAEAGIIRTHSGQINKPSAIRGYEASLNRYLVPELGPMRLSSINRKRVQEFVEELVRMGLAPASVANAIAPLRVIYRRAIETEGHRLESCRAHHRHGRSPP